MIINCSADWHLRFKRPRYRLDEDYLGTILDKIDQVLSIDADYYIVSGDIFDNPDIPYYVFQAVLEKIKKHDAKLLVVFGQHDLRYRTSKENTPLFALSRTENVEILTDMPSFKNIDYTLYGCSFGEEIPSDINKDEYNILVIHKMIVKDGPLWPGQEGFSYARNLLRSLPFDLIVSGDNHQSFIETYKGKTLINPGSLMRNKIDQVSHCPQCVLFDTEKRTSKVHKLKVEKFDKIMNVDLAEEEKDRNENLDAFIDTLEKGNEEIGLDFVQNMVTYLKENNLYNKSIGKLIMGWIHEH